MYEHNGAIEAQPPRTARSVGSLRFSQVVQGVPTAIGTGFSALQFRFSDFSNATMSPFVMVDHFTMWEPTFDTHPHAGMSAVTLVFEDTQGLMVSRDSVGHEATFGAGALHWTLAGRGILHTQLPADANARIHALQIFVNLPARLKSIAPDSFHVTASDMPELKLAGVRIRVVAGTFDGQVSPALTPEPVLMLDGYLKAQHDPISIPLQPGWNAWIHVVDGSLHIGNGPKITAGEALCASTEEVTELLRLEADTAAHFVVLAGPRIDEPVIQRGPFVFESEASLAQAIANLKAGRFGRIETQDL